MSTPPTAGVVPPPPPPTPQFIDDKTPLCIPFILSHLAAHQSRHSTTPKRPLLIGLNGIQGSGKTTLTRSLATTLQQSHKQPTLVISIDDFYLPRAEQAALAATHPQNPLIQVRGEPGTHDVPLLTSFLSTILAGRPARVPAYDKSAFNGLGDRVPETEWRAVNQTGSEPLAVVILEGWCVGFGSLSEGGLDAKVGGPSRTLGRHRREDLAFVNARVREYEAIWRLFDALIHVDAEDTEYVYAWRPEQERMLRAERGTGMTDEEVERFVDAYYPAYELYVDRLRVGIFEGQTGRQLRLVVGRDRRVRENMVI